MRPISPAGALLNRYLLSQGPQYFAFYVSVMLNLPSTLNTWITGIIVLLSLSTTSVIFVIARSVLTDFSSHYDLYSPAPLYAWQFLVGCQVL